MDLRLLTYFQVTARYESLTRAAEELYLTQPALSRAIARLEDELGVRLFDRTPSAIRLNEYGQAYLRSVQEVTAELRRGRSSVRQMAGLEEGRANLVCSCPAALSAVLRQFVRRYPDTVLEQEALPDHMIFIKLKRSSADLGVTVTETEDTNLRCTPLTRDVYRLWVTEDHPWAGRGTVGAEELEETPLLLHLPVEGARAGVLDGVGRICRAPNIRFTCTQLDPVAELVREGRGIGLVSGFAPPAPGLTALPLEGGPVGGMLYLVERRGKLLSGAAQALKNLICAAFTEDDR